MPLVRKSNGELVMVPCTECIKDMAAELCPRCGHRLTCLFHQLVTELCPRIRSAEGCPSCG